MNARAPSVGPAAVRLAACAVLALPVPGAAQQVADSAWRPLPAAPAWPRGTGPVVLVDQAHANGARVAANFRPFTDLLEADGYRVERLAVPATRELLARGSILVIINALSPSAVNPAVAPTLPAFDSLEQQAIVAWVRGGGALLLVADHMPFPGAAERLARALGAEFTNGFAIDTPSWDPIVFRRSDGSLAAHPISEGRSPDERVDSVTTFEGQAFRLLDPRGRSLMTFRPGVISYYPDTAWAFPHPWVPERPVDGWHQGAALTVGRGRVLMLGEAAMASAQLVGRDRRPVGMNAAVAGHNQRFVLNGMRWLAGMLPPR